MIAWSRIFSKNSMFNLQFSRKCIIIYQHFYRGRQRLSGRSAARLARLLWEQKVGGSNPLAPISHAPIAQLDRATDF